MNVTYNNETSLLTLYEVSNLLLTIYSICEKWVFAFRGAVMQSEDEHACGYPQVRPYWVNFDR